MNKEQTVEAIKVMQAYVDGSEVEMQVIAPNSKWVNDSDPDWNCMQCRYRIKPKLHEGFVHIDAIHTGCYGRADCIKVRETLE